MSLIMKQSLRLFHIYYRLKINQNLMGSHHLISEYSQTRENEDYLMNQSDRNSKLSKARDHLING